MKKLILLNDRQKLITSIYHWICSISTTKSLCGAFSVIWSTYIRSFSFYLNTWFSGFSCISLGFHGYSYDCSGLCCMCFVALIIGHVHVLSSCLIFIPLLQFQLMYSHLISSSLCIEEGDFFSSMDDLALYRSTLTDCISTVVLSPSQCRAKNLAQTIWSFLCWLSKTTFKIKNGFFVQNQWSFLQHKIILWKSACRSAHFCWYKSAYLQKSWESYKIV